MIEEFRDEARRSDASDAIARVRDEFVVPNPEIIYLDGNSLGRLPRTARDRLYAVIDEWAGELIDGWRRWLSISRESGDLLAPVLGAEPGEVVLADSTSVNLYKLAVAALDARPDRRVIVADDDNFPTDQYVLDGIAEARGLTVRRVHADIDNGLCTADLRRALDEDVALVCLSHVAYRSGAVADLAQVTAAAHERGALTLWDLCHSAGAVKVGLAEAGADLAVGCTYKYLNGGPGAPAFLYVRRDLQPLLRQPIWGWFGQADQFAMGRIHRPVPTIDRFQVGTPAVLAGCAAQEGIRLVAMVGIDAIARKVRGLTSYAGRLADAWLTEFGFRSASPGPADRRGAHLALYHPAAWQICQAAKSAGVIADYRLPDRLRLGFAPLYTRYIDVFEAFRRLREIMLDGRYRSLPSVPSGLS